MIMKNQFKMWQAKFEYEEKVLINFYMEYLRGQRDRVTTLDYEETYWMGVYLRNKSRN